MSKQDEARTLAGKTFKSGTRTKGLPYASVNDLAFQGEGEPAVEQGVDLTGQPKIVFAAGRGKTGKTTLLRWISEISLRRGASVILADVDPSNASYSLYFNEVARPGTDNPTGVVRWLQNLIEHCVNDKQSAIIDLGGGDTTLRTLATELPGLAQEMEQAGLSPVMLYLLGTQADDLAPALTLTARGFVPKAQSLVLNEFAVDAGQSRDEAFEWLLSAPGLAQLLDRSVRVWMPRLFAAEAIEARRCSFLNARDGKVSPPLGMFDAARLRAWLDAMDRRFAGISSWIP